jgi:hypothetical protein
VVWRQAPDCGSVHRQDSSLHGGPEGARQTCSMHVTHVNQLITPHGITIARSSVADPDPSHPYVFGYGMFLGLLDPDPLVRGTDQDLPVFGHPGSRSVSKRSGSGSFFHQAKIVRKSISQRQLSADPDPYQNVMDL